MDGDSPGIVGIVPQHESDASTRHMPRIAYLFYGCHCLMHAWRLRPEKERRRRGRLGVHGRIFRSIEPPRRAAERPRKATTERGTRRGRRFASSLSRDSLSQLSFGRGWPQTYMSRYFFFENSHCTDLGALMASRGGVWPDWTDRRLRRHGERFPTTVLDRAHQRASLLACCPRGSCHVIAEPALEHLRCERCKGGGSHRP